MDDIETKERLHSKLARMLRYIEQKVETQEQFINRFQLLVQNDGLFSQVIDNLPYPVAVFEQSGAVRMANSTLLRKAAIEANDILDGKINLFDRVTDENYAIFEAAEDVFLGETTIVKDLDSPLSLFNMDETHEEEDTYQNAVFFPVPWNGAVKYGAVMLMK